MKTLSKVIPIVPVKKFIFPNGTYDIVIKGTSYFEQLQDALLYGKEIGVPYWFDEDFNVYGCTIKVLSVYQNHNKGFIRVKVEGLQLFRITKYSKKYHSHSLNEADINFLDFKNQKIENKSIMKYFTKITGAEIYDPKAWIKLLELLNWMNLRPELSIAIISKPTQEEREHLLARIMKFMAISKSQANISHLN